MVSSMRFVSRESGRMFVNVDSLPANSSLAARIRNRPPPIFAIPTFTILSSNTIFDNFETATDLRHVCCWPFEW
jgi:hypothetical protein